METVLTKTVISGVLTLLLIISGVWMRKSGEPYKTGIFTIHKLAITALTVFMVLIYIQHIKLFTFEGFGLFLFIISSLVFFIAFLTGALLSFEKIASYKLKIAHRVLSWFTILFIPVIWLYCH